LKPFGIAATLTDAAALATAFGTGTRLGIGAENATQSDILAPAGLTLQPHEIVAALRTSHPQYIFTFANTAATGLPGIIGPMIDVLAAASGTGFIPACLATPWAGRTVFQGHLFHNASLQGDLSREFASHLEGSAGIVPHHIIAAGSHAIRTQLAAMKEQGIQLALLDAIDEDQCAALADALTRHSVIAGPAWLSPQPSDAEPEQPTGPIAILSGALTRQTLFQIGAARAAMPVFDLDFSHSGTVAEAVTWVKQHLGNTPFIISASVPPDKILPATKAAEILAEMAETLVTAGIRRLVITGNDTTAAILAKLGITQLTAGAVIAGLRWLHHNSLAVLIKPGSFGGKNLFLHEFEPQSRLNAPAQ
jgi:uncharacterized protein YgbK (DUF1537 family)